MLKGFQNQNLQNHENLIFGGIFSDFENFENSVFESFVIVEGKEVVLEIAAFEIKSKDPS